MTTCDTCRFWARDGDRLEVCDEANDWEGETTGHYKCSLVVLAGFGDVIKREFSGNAAIVLDGEGHKAELWTLPSFGCNAYRSLQKKENPMPLPRCLARCQELQLPWYSIDALRNAGLEYVFRVCENQPCTEDIVRPAWNQYCEVMRRAGVELDCDLLINPTEGFSWIPRLSAHPARTGSTDEPSQP